MMLLAETLGRLFAFGSMCVRVRVRVCLRSHEASSPSTPARTRCHIVAPKIDTLETWKKGRTDIYIIYGLVFFVSQSCCNRQMRAISTYIDILYISKIYAL